MSRMKEYVIDMNEKNSEGKIILETLYGTFEIDNSDVS
jgi:hypothetical protein